MRHIRDFEDNNPNKETYCLFIAPKLHRDTINTFWISVKYEYEINKNNTLFYFSIYSVIRSFKRNKTEREIFAAYQFKRALR